jgi:hypothetical protein
MPLAAGLFGLGGASAVLMVTRYRWVFLALAVLSVVLGFYLNYVRGRSPWIFRALFWASSAFTLLTVAHWGWWRLI